MFVVSPGFLIMMYLNFCVVFEQIIINDLVMKNLGRKNEKKGGEI